MIEKTVESKNIPVKNKFIASVTNFYYHSLDYHPQPNLNFNASQHYIIKLKEGINYSTRLCHPKRRPNCSSDEIIKFLKICKFIMTTAKRSHVLNVDESFFRINETQNITWAKKGSDNVYTNTDWDDKQGFTFLGTIGFDGKRHPVVLISKGKTVRSEKNWFGAGHQINSEEVAQEPIRNPLYQKGSSHQEEFIIPNYRTDHTLSGWTTTESWKNYLKWLRNERIPIIPGTSYYEQKNRIYLISDNYGVHKAKDIIDYAVNLNIDLIFVPKGLTQIFQPLDIKIFETVKAQQRGIMNERILKTLLTAFDHSKGEIIGEIPMVKGLEKKEAAAILY